MTLTTEVLTVIMLYCYPADNALAQSCRKAMIQCVEKKKWYDQQASISECIKEDIEKAFAVVN